MDHIFIVLFLSCVLDFFLFAQLHGCLCSSYGSNLSYKIIHVGLKSYVFATKFPLWNRLSSIQTLMELQELFFYLALSFSLRNCKYYFITGWNYMYIADMKFWKNKTALKLLSKFGCWVCAVKNKDPLKMLLSNHDRKTPSVWKIFTWYITNSFH